MYSIQNRKYIIFEDTLTYVSNWRSRKPMRYSVIRKIEHQIPPWIKLGNIYHKDIIKFPAKCCGICHAILHLGNVPFNGCDPITFLKKRNRKNDKQNFIILCCRCYKLRRQNE